MRTPRSERKKAKAINKRLGRKAQIKRTNKYRGPGTTETSLMGGITKCWKGVCEKVDDVVTRTNKNQRKIKVPTTKKKTTVEKDPSGRNFSVNIPGINFPTNIGSGSLNIGGGSFSKTRIGKRNKFLNIESSQRDDPREDQFRTKYDDYSDIT
jgi:hypothetical protein